jgi:ribosomal protein L11 methyltransferase
MWEMNKNGKQNQKVIINPIRIGRNFMVIPANQSPPIEPGIIPVWIDPGKVFGSGTHPTTQLCIKALERHLSPGESVLDLGTGSGILSIGAAKLGAGPILGVDIDPKAVQVARANIAANQLDKNVRVEQGSLPEVLAHNFGPVQSSFVVANISVKVILNFFDSGLTKLLVPGGLIILSGFLRTQTPAIRVRLIWNGLELLAKEKLDDWVCIIARNP